MNGATSSPILQQIRRMVLSRAFKDSSDQTLLHQFTHGKDETAFQAILCRHGPMVLDVCRSVLYHEPDAEDAFQATFLILARKAGSIQKAKSLGAWLHGVAYRTARKAQAEFAKQRKHESRSAVTRFSTPEDPSWRDVQRVLHEELGHLTERHRIPLILCFLQGKTQDEVALLLGVPKRTLKRRLEEGRARLRTRLARRGLAPALLLLVSAWPTVALASSFVRIPLMTSTLKAANMIAAGGAVTTAVSVKVAALTEGVLKTMFLSKLRIVVAMLALSVLGVGIGGRIFTTATQAGQSQTAHVQDKVVPRQTERDELPDGKSIVGTWRVVSIEINGKVNRDPKSPGLSHGPWVISADKITQEGTHFTEEKGFFKGKTEMPYKLDATRSPKEIDLVSTALDGTDPRPMLGIYALDGDTLKICFAGVDEPRPKEFTTKPGSNLVLNVLKRQAPAKSQPDDGQRAAPDKGGLAILADLKPPITIKNRLDLMSRAGDPVLKISAKRLENGLVQFAVRIDPEAVEKNESYKGRIIATGHLELSSAGTRLAYIRLNAEKEEKENVFSFSIAETLAKTSWLYLNTLLREKDGRDTLGGGHTFVISLHGFLP